MFYNVSEKKSESIHITNKNCTNCVILYGKFCLFVFQVLTSKQQSCKERYLWKYSYGEVFYVHMSLLSEELMVKFEHIIDEHKQNDLYSPIEQVAAV